jgi:hypothetical protein
MNVTSGHKYLKCFKYLKKLIAVDKLHDRKQNLKACKITGSHGAKYEENVLWDVVSYILVKFYRIITPGQCRGETEQNRCLPACVQ